MSVCCGSRDTGRWRRHMGVGAGAASPDRATVGFAVDLGRLVRSRVRAQSRVAGHQAGDLQPGKFFEPGKGPPS